MDFEINSGATARDLFYGIVQLPTESHPPGLPRVKLVRATPLGPNDSMNPFKVASLRKEDSKVGFEFMRFGEAAVAPGSRTARIRAKKRERAYAKAAPADKQAKKKGNGKNDDYEVKEGVVDAAAWVWRYSVSSVRTLIAKIDTRPCPASRHTFIDMDGFRQCLVLPRGIGHREVEHAVVGRYDWTRDWDCVLSMRLTSRDDHVVAAAFYFKDLPARLKAGVPWDDAERTKFSGESIHREASCICCAEREWVCESRFHERAGEPAYAATIKVGHLGRMESLSHDPVKIISNSRVERYAPTICFLFHHLPPLFVSTCRVSAKLADS